MQQNKKKPVDRADESNFPHRRQSTQTSPRLLQSSDSSSMISGENNMLLGAQHITAIPSDVSVGRSRRDGEGEKEEANDLDTFRC